MPTNQAKGFESRCRERTEQPPRLLYKYASVESARRILSSGKVFFRSPVQYNDPFDSQWDVLWFTKTEDFFMLMYNEARAIVRGTHVWDPASDQSMKKLWEAEAKQIAHLPEPEQDAAIRERIKGIYQSPLATKAAGGFIDWVRRMRMFCLAKNPLLHLMWSHYADCHRGVVIGFDTNALERGWQTTAEPVKYRDDMPQICDEKAMASSWVTGVPNRKFIPHPRDVYLAKSSSWSYEQEWRFVYDASVGTLGDEELKEIPSGGIRQLFLGFRTDPLRVRELVSLALPLCSGLDVMQVRGTRGRFELQPGPLRIDPYEYER